jgi:hypothetical protein
MQPAQESLETQVAQLSATINQVGNPYRARLLAWLRAQTGQDMSDVEHGIRAWLSSLDSGNRADQLQFATIQMVIETTCQVFGEKSA